MQRRLIRVFSPARAFVLLGLCIAACGGSTSVTELTSPSLVRCQTSLSAPLAGAPADGGRLDVTIVAERECGWSASSDAEWVEVSPESGQGEAPVTLTVAANQHPSSRTATLVVNAQRFTITQDPAPCMYRLSRSTAHAVAAGASFEVRIETMNGCGWTAASDRAWIQVTPDHGSGPALVSIAVARNIGVTRTGRVTIGGQVFTLTQSAPSPHAPPSSPAPPVPAPLEPVNPTHPSGPSEPEPPEPTEPSEPSEPPAPSNPCTYGVFPPVASFESKGGRGSFHVAAPDGCAWTATSSSDWIHISDARGSGSGSATYKVGKLKDVNHDDDDDDGDGNGDDDDDDDDDDHARTGSIAVGGRILIVHQSGDDK